MKVVVTHGCTAYGCIVDDKDINDLSIGELRDTFKKLIDATESHDILINQIQDFVDQAGEWEFLYHCDQCGDDVYEYTMEV